MNFPKDFDDRAWWILVAIAGALIAAASAPVTFVPGVLVGLGLLAFGVGQWIDHPIRTTVNARFKITGYPWHPSVSGVTLSLGGGALFAIGLYRLLAL